MPKWDLFVHLTMSIVFGMITWGFYLMTDTTSYLWWKIIFWGGILSAGYWSALLGAVFFHTAYCEIKERVSASR